MYWFGDSYERHNRLIATALFIIKNSVDVSINSFQVIKFIFNLELMMQPQAFSIIKKTLWNLSFRGAWALKWHNENLDMTTFLLSSSFFTHTQREVLLYLA